MRAAITLYTCEIISLMKFILGNRMYFWYINVTTYLIEAAKGWSGSKTLEES